MRFILEVLAAAVGTVCFGGIMGVPKKYYPFCGLVGGAGWAVYFILWKSLQWVSEPTVVFVSTVLVIFLSRFFAVLKRCPVTIFLVCGILPLVPGAGIYWTSYYLVTNRLPEALSSGILAVKIAIAIVLGIVVVFEFPQGLFKRLAGVLERKKG